MDEGLPDTTPVLDTLSRQWQPLPARARPLFVAGMVLRIALPLALAGGVLAAVLPVSHIWLDALALVLAGAIFGAWLGGRRFGYTRWRLDADGFAVRRGRLWQAETRVPGSRVQHLDVRRGPLQRHYRLATLVIHTAGTRHSAVAVPCLDEGDAERLRDRLAHQADDEDDDA